jgi:hypothetical protein
VTRREEIARQRAELQRRPRLRLHGSEWLTVALLMVILKTTGSLTFSWLDTIGVVLGWMIGDAILNYILTARNR